MRNYRNFSALEEGYLRDHPEEVDDYMTILFEEYAELEKLLSQPNPSYIDAVTLRKFLISRGADLSESDDFSLEELRYWAIESSKETLRLNMERQAKRRETLASRRADKAT